MTNHRSNFFRYGMKGLAGLFFILSAQTASAAYINDNCTDDYQMYENTRIQIGRFGDAGECFVSVTTNPNFNPKYRDYLMTNNGLLMVFNSYGDGDPSTMTGAREYYFPSKLKQNFILSYDQGLVKVALTDDVTITINAKTGKPTQITNMSFSLSSSINPNNKGGLEISNPKIPMIDSGFAMGRSPTSIDTGKSYIKRLKESCELINRELYDNSEGDAILRYKNKDFDNFVVSRCPNI